MKVKGYLLQTVNGEITLCRVIKNGFKIANEGI